MTMHNTQAVTQDDGLSASEMDARRKALLQRARRRAFSLIELLIVIEVVMVLAAIALPGLKVSRKASYEANAVLALRQLSDAQELYRPRQMPPTYAARFDALKEAGLVDGDLGDADGRSFVRRSGYNILITGRPDQNTYAFTAVPASQGQTGDRSFYVDQTGLIRMADDASVSSTSPPLQ